MINRPLNHHLIATLVEYVRGNNLDEFERLFNTVILHNSVLRISLQQTHEGMTLYQHIIKHRAKRFFRFLIDKQFSEKDGEFESAPNYQQTIRYLVDFMYDPNENVFHCWFDLILANRHLINADLNETYQSLTLLQHACLSKPGLITKLMDAGIGVNVSYSAENIPDTHCVKSIQVLLDMRDENGKELLLTELVLSSIMHYAARCNQLDILRRTLKGSVDINMQDVNEHTALYYAVKKEYFDIVILLLAHGAEPYSVLEDVYESASVAMLEKLLFHGAGMFRNFPVSFFTRSINVNFCYVEGMTVDGKPVSKKTVGFHNAFFTIEEMLAYKALQDSLDLGTINQALPLHSISQCFTVLQRDPEIPKSPAFNHAMSTFQQANRVPSLQFTIKKLFQKNRFNREFLSAAATQSLECLIKNFPVDERTNLLGLIPDQQHALAVLNDRVDELVAFSEEVKKAKIHMLRVDKIHEYNCVFSLYGNAIVDIGFAIHVFSSCCVMNSASEVCCCCYSCVTTPMLGFGVPGFIALALTLTTAILAGSYRYRAGNICLESTENNILARRNKQLAAVLDALIVLMGHEALPATIAASMGNLARPDITFMEVEKTISKIITYYKEIELPRVRENKSDTPLHAFNAGLFYWNDDQRRNNRNIRLLPLLRMNEEGFDVQTELGYSLFEEINPDRDELEEEAGLQDGVNIPLFRMK